MGGSTDRLASRIDGPIHTARHVRIICIGAGASGLCLAYKLQRHFDNFSLIIYEKNPEVSGTWYENRYPGSCACDIAAHAYTYTFEPKPDWSAVYSGSREIFKYFNDFAAKYDLFKYVRLRHQVVGAWWNHEKGGYDLKIRDIARQAEIEDHCDILINAGGILNNWKWPNIPGLDLYRGTLLHTANWDESVDLRGKTVGLIGNGSSGIQVLPTIQPYVRHVTTFVREPTWVSPTMGLDQHVYTEDEKARFARDPNALAEYRKSLETSLNSIFSMFIKDSEAAKMMLADMQNRMGEKLKGLDAKDRLIPTWPVGCRRPTPGVGYLEALTKDNVALVHGGVSSVSEKGPVGEDGQEYPVEVLICATGFDTSFAPRFPIVGSTGVNLQDAWRRQPHSYLGFAAADLDNYFHFIGPNCPVGNGPVITGIEAQADYMLKMIDRFQTHNIAKFSPKAAAVADFIAHKDQFMQKTVWTEPCRSWYKPLGPDGPVTALWPGSTLHYLETLMEVRWEDWDIEYSGNRFAWLGNGYSQIELDETADKAFYMRNYDDDAPLSRGRMKKLISKSGSVKPGAEVTQFMGSKL